MYGFHGTSVREIAKDAHVNVSLISYYFGGKHSLLEKLMSAFWEGYLEVIETSMNQLSTLNITDRLVTVADRLLTYQSDNTFMARFVHREMTTDSVLTRELMTTYLMKEKYLYETIFAHADSNNEMNAVFIDMVIMQFRELINLPYMQSQYIQKVHFFQLDSPYFRKQYLKAIRRWVEQTVSQSNDNSSHAQRITSILS